MKNLRLFGIVLAATVSLLMFENPNAFGQTSSTTTTTTPTSGTQLFGTSDQVNCNQTITAMTKTINDAQATCGKMGVPNNLPSCAAKVGQCGYLPDDSDNDDSLGSTNSLGSYCQDNSSDPACSSFCKQQYANSIASSKKDYFDEMKSANDAAGSDEDKLADSAKSEAATEKADQDQISKAQQDLLDAEQKVKEQEQSYTQDYRDKTNAIMKAVADLRNKQQNIMNQRLVVLNNYQVALAQAKLACVTAIKAAAGNGAFQVGNISDLFAAQGAGGLANSQCANDRTTRIADAQALSTAQTQLNDLTNQYQQTNTDITDQMNQLSALRLTLGEKDQLAMYALQIQVQKAQTAISSAQTQLQKDQQIFQQTQQMEQTRLQRDEAIAQQATQQNNNVTTQLSGLGSSIIPNASASTSTTLDSSVQTISEAVADQCVLKAINQQCTNLADATRAACTTGKGGGSGNGSGGGNADTPQ